MGWFNKVVTQKLGIYQIVYNVCHVCVLRSNLGDCLRSLFVHRRSQLVVLDLDLHDFFRRLVVHIVQILLDLVDFLQQSKRSII